MKAIGLCMIVKNESKVILRCLESVRPIVDYVLIEDTGSTDGTQAVIREWLDRVELPGEVYDEPWRDFAYNRSHALTRLREKRDVDYALIMDADDVLELPPGFRMPHLKADSYSLEIWHQELRYWRTQLIRNALPWRYEGVLHEFLSCPAECDNRRTLPEERSQSRLPGVRIQMSEEGARRTISASERFRRDAAILESALASETDPFLISRYTFYLAQSYRDCGEPQKALANYLKRAELGFGDQEVFISLCQAAKLMADLGFDEENVISAYLRAHSIRKDRAEALHGAARFCRVKERFEESYKFAERALGMAVPPDGLFLELWVYDYGVLDEYAVAAYQIGKFDDCQRACERLLQQTRIPADVRERVEKNARFAREHLSKNQSGQTAPSATGVDQIFLSLYDAAERLRADGRPFDEVIAAYDRASSAAPNRAEALHNASRLCRLNNKFAEGYEYARRGLAILRPDGGLSIQQWIYDYGLLDEFAVNAYWTGRYAECVEACDRLLREGKLPQETRDRVLSNKAFGVDKLRDVTAQECQESQESDAFITLLRAAREKEQLARPDHEVISTYLEASAACPTRAEALHGAARFCRNKGMYEQGYQCAAQGLATPYPKDVSGVEDWIYEYGLLDELAVNAYWIGRYKECADACDRLLTDGKLPTENRERVIKNKQFAIDKLQEAAARLPATDNQRVQFETPRWRETVVSQVGPPPAVAKEDSPALGQPVRAQIPQQQAICLDTTIKNERVSRSSRAASSSLHILGVPHTIPHEDYLVCAFTAKVLLFPEVIQPFGWDVVEYSNEGSASKAREHVVILTKDRLGALSRRRSREEPFDADVDNTDLKIEFQRVLLDKIRSRARPGDIVCHISGPNMEVYNLLPECHHIELCVGYTAWPGLPFRIYESSAWMHWHYGKAGQEDGNNYKWVIPSPLDAERWTFHEKPDDYALFLGRVTPRKGIDTLIEIARRMPELPIRVYGPGDSSHWANAAPPNLAFKGPVFGDERVDVVRRARCMLMPTVFIEPFGNSGIEAQLCGVPLIATSYGAFQETVIEGVTGYRCHTLADWVEAIQTSRSLDRRQIATLARAKYSKEVVGKQYDWVLKQLADLSGRGWYADKSRKFANAAVSPYEDKPRKPRIWLFVPYFGAFPNYFQLYLDSLRENADCLSVFLMTDNSLSGYQVPDNLIPIQLTLSALREKAARLINHEFGMNVQPDALLNQPYKLCDFRIMYPELFRDVSEQYGVTDDDFLGWGDCDLIYGRFSDFLDMKEDYQIIGGFHGHFTALRNTHSFRKLFKAVEGLPRLLVDEKSHLVDEIAFRKPLLDFLERSGYRMFYINRYFCDIVPECFFGLFRQDHAERKKNFFDVYHSDKEIDYVHYDRDGRLTVVYEDGDSRQSIYCHLQKRTMLMDFERYENGYYIHEDAFRLVP